MADITDEIAAISTAHYGREVRGNIVDALTAMNEETTAAYSRAHMYKSLSDEDIEALGADSAKLVDPGNYYVAKAKNWTNVPDTAYTWAYIVLQFNANYVAQIAVNISDTEANQVYWRLVRISTGVPSGDWQDVTGSAEIASLTEAVAGLDSTVDDLSDTVTTVQSYPHWLGSTSATDYDGNVANVSAEGSFFATGTGWTDTPSSATAWCITNERINSYYNIQKAYAVGTNAYTRNDAYWRIVARANGEVYPEGRKWTRFSNEGAANRYAGKKCSVYGDSISTFTGYALGYDQYPGSAAFQAASGVTSVNQTWWMRVINHLNMELLSNASIMGRCVTEARQDAGPTVHLTSAAYRQSRIEQLKSGTTVPDVILVKVGVNDYNHGAYLGELEPTRSISEIESEFTDGVTDTGNAPQNAKNFTQGYKVMLKRLMTTYPTAEIWCCTIDHMKPSEHGGGQDKPEVNRNNEPLSAYNQRIVDVATQMGCKVIRHDEDGITSYNQDVTTADTIHPSAEGMTLVANQTLRAMG